MSVDLDQTKQESLTAAFHCLSSLKLWDIVFQDNRPYTIVAKMMSGERIGPGDLAWIDDMQSKINTAIEAIGVSNGALVACRHVLEAIRMAGDDEINAQHVYNLCSKAAASIEKAKYS